MVFLLCQMNTSLAFSTKEVYTNIIGLQNIKLCHFAMWR